MKYNRDQKRACPVVPVSIMLGLVLLLSGCRSNLPDPKAFKTPPPLDVYSLSAGKITHFVPVPGLEYDSDNSMLLEAIGLSNIKGPEARKGYVTFQSRTGNNVVGCLVVGNNILVVLEDFQSEAFGEVTFSASPGSPIIIKGPPYDGKPFLETKYGQLYLYQDSRQYIQISPNEATALVGGKRVPLSQPVLWQDGKHPLRGDHVMLLSDLLRLLHEHDKQIGSGTSIRNVKIIYDLRDYHR